MGLVGILVALGLLVWLSFRGWSVLLLAPAVAIVAAAFAGEPLLAHWTQTFMGSAANFIAQFFPIFLLGALFGKLMDDSGSVLAIARFISGRLGQRRAILAVVLAGALVTYGGVSLFVAFFVLAPMARELFRVADIPHRLMPAAIALGTSTFTMSAMPGTPAIQNTIPMPFFGTTPFAAPGLGMIASAIMLAFGLWWLTRAEASARKSGEGYGRDAEPDTGTVADDQFIRERATSSHGFDPTEITHGKRSDVPPPISTAIIPLLVVVGVNLLMSVLILPRLDFSFLGQARWGGTSLAGVAGVWSVAVALAAATATLIALNRARLTDLRASMDAGANASVLPIFSVASLVGFGAVVAALPAFALVRDWVLSISGGPLVSLAIATNVLAALTGSASGGLTIALDALGDTYLQIARTAQIDPGLMHRIAVIGSGTLDSLPHNGAVVTLLAVCGSTHRDSYFDIVMANIVGPVIALAAVIVFGAATVIFALSQWMWLSVLALALLGAADTISVVIRFSLVQLSTPDEMRGRVGAVNFLFINASNQLGQFESGVTAALLGTVPAAVLGGVGTIAIALLWMKLFPALRKVERLE
jgi:H+/gluconate symporter-like permease